MVWVSVPDKVALLRNWVAFLGRRDRIQLKFLYLKPQKYSLVPSMDDERIAWPKEDLGNFWLPHLASRKY